MHDANLYRSLELRRTCRFARESFVYESIAECPAGSGCERGLPVRRHTGVGREFRLVSQK